MLFKETEILMSRWKLHSKQRGADKLYQNKDI